MAWGDMMFSGGLDLLKAGLSYTQARAEASSQRRWQAYNNAMVNITAGIAQNGVTINENLARERSIEQGIAIRKSEYATAASVEASAAATGTTGRSVNAVLFDVHRSASEADSNRQNDWENQEVGFNYQRQNIAQKAQNSLDLRSIPNPSLATTILGLGSSGQRLYRENRTEIDSFIQNL